MKKTIKKTAYILFVATVILLTVVFSSYSYGWLINYVKKDFSFTTFEYKQFTLEIAKITATTEAPEATENVDPETQRGYTTVENNKIEANADGSHYAVELGNMSFGAIDNVAQLKNENVVYLRLTVPKSLDKTINLSLHYSDDNFIQLYKTLFNTNGEATGTEEVKDKVDENGNNITTITDLIGVEGTVGSSFLLYDAIVSNTAYEAKDIAANFEATTETLESELENKFAGEKNNNINRKYKQFVTKPNDTDATVLAAEKAKYDENSTSITNNAYGDLTADNYYIYVKVVPNLEVFAHSIEYISDIMPCYMFFKVEATIDAPEVTIGKEVTQ